jgi:hypothetical protein
MSIRSTRIRTFFSNKLYWVALFVMTVLFSAFRLMTPVDLTGEWKLNANKSDLGEFSQFAPKRLSIHANATGASVDRFSPDQSGQERSSKDSLSYDGKETQSTVFGNSKKTSTVKWSEDGQTMTVNSLILLDRNGETMEIKIEENWKLDPKGESLLITSTSNSSFGTNTMKMVFDKSK